MNASAFTRVPQRASGSLPMVVAHRGASSEQPEHTLAAYRRAIELGSPGLECDVRLTLDGELVCVHDRSLSRTSTGDGLVSTSTLAELRALDWGSWKASANSSDAGLSGRSTLVTLRELFELVKDAGQTQIITVETRHPVRFGGAVERSLAELLLEFGWTGQRDASPVQVMSFSSLAVRRMRSLLPHVPLVYLRDSSRRRLGEWWVPEGVAQGIGVSGLRKDPEYVHRVRASGRAVYVWTVDHPEDVQRCLDVGVDAIITNRPAEVMAQIAGAKME